MTHPRLRCLDSCQSVVSESRTPWPSTPSCRNTVSSCLVSRYAHCGLQELFVGQNPFGVHGLRLAPRSSRLCKVCRRQVSLSPAGTTYVWPENARCRGLPRPPSVPSVPSLVPVVVSLCGHALEAPATRVALPRATVATGRASPRGTTSESPSPQSVTSLTIPWLSS